MSNAINQRYNFWNSIETWFRGALDQHPLQFKGENLNREDQVRVFEAVMLETQLIEGSLQYLFKVDFVDPKRWLPLWWSYDLFELIGCLDRAQALLLTNVEDSLALDYSGFKHHLSDEYPFVGALLAPIKGIVDSALRTSNSVVFRCCFSCLKFLTKLHLQSEPLEGEALEKWIAVDQGLKDDGFTVEESKIIEDWFPWSQWERLALAATPHHGDGSTADAGTDLVEKYLSMGTDPRIHYLCAHGGLDEFDLTVLVRNSKLCFVPKSYKAYRPISMEPATLMWYQEGLKDALVAYMRSSSHPLSVHYDDRCQDRNRLWAQIGSSLESSSDSYCTIDLSAASDSVSWGLVRAWMSHSGLYPLLFLTRSGRTVLPDGRLYEMKKYAPMGCALTFPVEVIVFSAMVEAVFAAGGHRRRDYLVYGDDIIVPRVIYDDVVKRLELNGFTVNSDKSFHGFGDHRFRESCGGFYLDGEDVTPLVISRKFKGFHGEKSRWIPSAIDLANAASFHREERLLRLWVIHKVNDTLPENLRVPFCADGKRGFYSRTPTNYHLKTYFDAGLQEDRMIHGQLAQRSAQYPDKFSSILLYEWLRRAEVSGRSVGNNIAADPDWVITLPTPKVRSDGLTPDTKDGGGLAWRSTNSMLEVGL